MAQRLVYFPYLVVFLGLIALSAVSLPSKSAAADGGYSCGQITTSWPAAAPDCDGFTSEREDYVRTLKYVTCPETATRFDEQSDAWPADLDDNQMVNMQDVLLFSPVLGQSVYNGGSSLRRFDLNDNHVIDVGDVLALSPYFGTNCNMAGPAPAATVSHYMQTVDGLEQMGHNQAGPSALDEFAVILDFGQPAQCAGGAGTNLFGAGGCAEITTRIEPAVIDYLSGFINGRGAATPYLFLIVGTNSFQGTVGGVTREHGAAWAQMINSIRSWIFTNHYENEMDVLGGSDIEAADSGQHWAESTDAGSWADGFQEGAASGSLYVDYGDAGGCPLDPVAQPVIPGGSCNGDWTQESVYQVASGNDSAFVPLPDIYDHDGNLAAQWFALYDYAEGTGRFLFIGGALTQHSACYEDGGNQECLSAHLENTPAYGYMQLWVEFFSVDDPHPQPLGWSSDISSH